MQTVPSLVGSGTAIAAAASGLPNLALTVSAGHPTDNFVSPRPAATSTNPEPSHHHRTTSHPSPPSRPPLSRYQRPKSSQFSNTLPLVKPAEPSSSIGRRDSASSNGTWIRRLSIRPLSQHGSVRSSILTESPSVTFSNPWSTAHLSDTTSLSSSSRPNKLVKRPSTARNSLGLGDISPRQWPKSHLSSLRRPTTSHQRPGTSQLFRPDSHVPGTPPSSKHSFDRPIRPEELLGVSPFGVPVNPGLASGSEWTSFFHSRASKPAASLGPQDYPGDASLPLRGLSLKRICPEGARRQSTPHLIKPRMLSSSMGSTLSPSSPTNASSDRPPKPPIDVPASSEAIPPTRTIRSLSASFSSASSWVTKRSGSLRRSKRGSDRRSSKSQRHMSDPPESTSPPYQRDIRPPSESPDSSLVVPKMPLPVDQEVHQRLPLPLTLSPTSPSPSIVARSGGDLSRSAGRSRGTMARQNRPNHPSGSSTSSTVISQFARVSLHERSPVTEGFDGDARGFTSGDDDDTDLKSDTLFDSLRTLASSRARVIDTPLESVYDESPPSTAGNGKTMRLSVQDVLGRSWDEEDRIMEEEDEHRLTSAHGFSTHDRAKFMAVPRPAGIAPGQSTLDDALDDDDEDWTKDDDVTFSKSPSAPPKGTSARPRGINPNVQMALPSVERGIRSLTSTPTGRPDRPLSNLFDWSETSAHGKHEGGENCLRPKTAYAIPLADSRGGRAAVRKGPTPTHVRSQSVPVVHDSPEESKPAGPKYGTWGLSTKTVSEDWDEDFEFGAGAGDGKDGPAGRDREDVFAVPESIRATQPSVRAHSGQIRELSLLVNDLKRLFRHGRELNMLNGEQTGLWREAEGIITLASPDEDDANEGPRTESDSDQWGASVDSSEASKWRTTVVRERQSPRRRSVLSPEEDVFGASWPTAEDCGGQQDRTGTPRTLDGKTSDVSGVVRCVMESLRKPARPAEAARPSRSNDGCHGRVQFDTNNLKELVKRAGELRDVLSDMIRKADWMTQSPTTTTTTTTTTPRHECRLDSSPAFTRMFDDPCSTPPRRVPRSRGSNLLMEGTPSPEKSSSSPMGPKAMTFMHSDGPQPRVISRKKKAEASNQQHLGRGSIDGSSALGERIDRLAASCYASPLDVCRSIIRSRLGF
ncbi:hypothetical protein L249_8640 [Ophiocordyceps polyrhachis-furcata BCC 54312]|uniref:Uncharacterized protein n=1 Tax=Ophiocordyceps polyrhachis-furcata BCC 54312 TaxID=1330021 RepID=A0A367L6X3_9HYPO|nr:hypothetical protein L249_8640 [Ophiocordyceps polyrhachis-furcata BCC 54312]